MKSIDRLIAGYRSFKKSYFGGTCSLFKQLSTRGQKPRVLVIGCSDSRVDPAIILNCKPGDLFTIRNVANLVPPCEEDGGYHGTSAALEYAVCTLEVEHIIIFGHTNCGGLKALIENAGKHHDTKSFIDHWMDIAEPALAQVKTHHKDQSLQEQVTLCEQYALLNSEKNLLTFPWLKARVKEHKLEIHLWFFDIATGTIQAFDRETTTFHEI